MILKNKEKHENHSYFIQTVLTLIKAQCHSWHNRITKIRFKTHPMIIIYCSQDV